jgi:microcystin-dependent protein
MSETYLGEIRTFGFAFAPRGTSMCNGQILAINQFTALYSLLGTYYGGNGTSTFGLPNLQGRVPMHQGQLAGGSNYVLAQTGGTERTTLTINNLPAHNHTFNGSLTAITAKASAQAPADGSLLARTNDQYGTDSPQIYVPAGTTGTTAALGGLNGTVGVTGGSQPVSLLQPYLTLNFCINLQGIYPSRS